MLTWSAPHSRVYDPTDTQWIPRSKIMADSVAWMVALTVGDAVTAEGDATGLIVVSTVGPAESLARVRHQAQQARVSPRAFAAAGPGTVAGLACILHQISGPTLAFSTMLTPAAPLFEAVVNRWLSTGGCDHVIVCEHRVDAPSVHVVELRTVRRSGD